jgi:pilus assembly protein TadC
MSLITNLVNKRPELKLTLYMAGINETPESYVKKKLKIAIYTGIMMGVLSFMLLDKQGKNPLPALFVAFITVVIIYKLMMRQAEALVAKRAKLIDRDVLFAGRFLLVKLNSGRPLINALEDATKSYGISNEYFKEIIRDIDLGTPLEKALEKGTHNCPSEKLKKILFQITNALKIGTDVTNFLDAILDQIADEQLIEIQRYGKKLGSITMFYMLFAVVLPSLGMTMIIIIVSLISIQINATAFIFILVLLAFLQFIFITLFRSIRPNVNI